MRYVVQQAFEVLKNLVYAEANARAPKTEILPHSLPKHDFFAWLPINFMHAGIFALIRTVCKLIPKGAFVIITERLLGISLGVLPCN